MTKLNNTVATATKESGLKQIVTGVTSAFAPYLVAIGILIMNAPSAEAYTTRCTAWGGQVRCTTTSW